MFASYTIKQRLWILTICFCLNMIGVGAITYFFTHKLVTGLDEIANVAIPESRHISMADMAHDAIRGDVFRGIVSVERNDSASFEDAKKELAEHISNINEHIAELEKLKSTPEALAAEKDAKDAIAVYAAAANAIFEKLSVGKVSEATSSVTEFQKAFEGLEQELEGLAKLFEEDAQGIVEGARQTSRIAQILNGVLVVFGVLMAVGFGAWLTAQIVADLKEIMKKLSAEAQQLSDASANISLASQNLSEATTEQAAAIEETVASMEEMTSMLAQTSNNATRSLQVSDEGSTEATKGTVVISKMIASMDEIEHANDKLENINKLVMEIGNKTKVINDIVFETRLLAFNASIEAARAGVHGKGFAVVAEEVGKLASMSGKAADEIRTLLESSIVEVNRTVSETRERVLRGKAMSQDCEVAFQTMGNTLSKIAESIRLIASAAKEQEIGVKQTNRAMNEMDKVTQANSRSAESLANQSTTVDSGAKRIAQSISALKRLVVREAGDETAIVRPTSIETLKLDDEPLKTKATILKTKPSASAPTSQSEVSRDDSRWSA